MRLQVHNRCSIHSIQSTNLEDRPFDVKHIHQTQANGIGTVWTSGGKDPTLGNSRVSPRMDPEGLTVCHVEPAENEKSISNLNTVQTPQDCLLHDKLGFHTGWPALMWGLISLF